MSSAKEAWESLRFDHGEYPHIAARLSGRESRTDWRKGDWSIAPPGPNPTRSFGA